MGANAVGQACTLPPQVRRSTCGPLNRNRHRMADVTGLVVVTGPPSPGFQLPSMSVTFGSQPLLNDRCEQNGWDEFHCLLFRLAAISVAWPRSPNRHQSCSWCLSRAFTLACFSRPARLFNSCGSLLRSYSSSAGRFKYRSTSRAALGSVLAAPHEPSSFPCRFS